MKCYKCWMLDVKDREIKQLKEQQEAILDMMQLAFCAVSLWAQATGLEKSDSPEEDVREELADRKEKIRTLFENLVEAGQYSFIDRLARALNLPQNSEQLLEVLEKAISFPDTLPPITAFVIVAPLKSKLLDC